MEEARQFSCFPIDTGDIRSLVTIAVNACKSEVADLGRSAMLAGYDVVNLKRRRVKRCRQLTIFAPVVSAFPGELNNIGIHPVRLILVGSPQ